MNIEDYRDYCLSLGADVEEKLPFTAFRYAADVLVFYVCGHMFAFLDIDHYGIVTLKCQPERIDELKARYDCIGKPFNLPSKYWIGVDAPYSSGLLAPRPHPQLLRDRQSQI
jgi:predicted DNA-binding protein (MmcQ/YjbR family)